MSVLADKIRRARERSVPAGGHVFIVRRPTDLDMLGMKGGKPVDFLRFVVGWEQVNEIDLIPGGDPTPAPFDLDACTEWLSDRPDLLVPVTNGVIEAYQSHKAALGAAEKN